MKLDFKTDGGIGTRANLGLVVLETDQTLEHEFARIMASLSGVALYHSRIPMVAEVNENTLSQMEHDLPASVELFPPSTNFAAIGYACTSASVLIGSARVAEIIGSVCPDVATSDPLAAVIAAGKFLGIERLGFLTPYVPSVSQRMLERLEEAGFSIASFGSFEEGDDRVVARITTGSLLEGIEAVISESECDGVFVACTNLRCLEIIPEAEARFGIPILSSNQALAWHMLRLAGIEDSFSEFGRLFSGEPPRA